MPASEQTWRSQKLLHMLFAISGVALLVSTMWMLMADHNREWKPFQQTANKVEIQMTDWRKVQYETDQALRDHERLNRDLMAVRGRGLDPQLIEQFKVAVEGNAEESNVSPDGVASVLSRIDAGQQQLQRAAADAAPLRGAATTARADAAARETAANDARKALAAAQKQLQQARQAGQGVQPAQAAVTQQKERLEQLEAAAAAAARQAEAADKELLESEQQIGRLRDRFLNGVLQSIFKKARFREDSLLRDRKFIAADLDAAKARLGLMVRDDRREIQEEVQQQIDRLNEGLEKVTLEYQDAASYRAELQRLTRLMTEDEDQIRKDLDDSRADLERLDASQKDRRSRYFENFLGLPVAPGKKWLELPILDAFNSPLQVENLWSAGLTQDYNFRRVRRFDRCTTCHQAIDNTMPGSAVDPAYEHERLIEIALTAPAEDELAEQAYEPGTLSQEEALDKRLEGVYGMQLASAGLVNRQDVTVKFVRFGSSAAQAEPLRAGQQRFTGQQLRDAALHSVNPALSALEARPGLLVGDVIVEIDGDRVDDKRRAALRMLDAAGSGDLLLLTVRRGLPHPYASHPRLDLFVGSLSPHAKQTFGCTVCHEGQGSATAFKWASHTPNSLAERERWDEEHGWFDNVHWIYPMFPQRFVESGCLKCHHEVTELEPSPRFPDPPAPELVHGYHLIRKHGCYGCHEINGYDGPDKRVGPDIRLEPNYFAVAQELSGAPNTGYENLLPGEKELVAQLVDHPDRDDVRHKLYQLINQDASREGDEQRLSKDVHQRLGPLLQDIETPGTERKTGPSLRYVAEKLDDEFLYDWLVNPRHFRPGTRMPRFFGLWDHLEGEDREVAAGNEPVEIVSMLTYLKQRSQSFEYLPQSEVTASDPDEQQARGKVLLQERGCLACHAHKDFPGVEAFRPADAIQQGPDLSAIGDKFDPSRNPDGFKWLYSWIKQPTRYHARTVMPNLYLDPIEHRDQDGNVVQVTDPAADITAYLLAASRTGWQPQPGTVTELSPEQVKTLKGLTMEHLLDSFYVSKANQYIVSGIPERRRNELKTAERELLVPDADFDTGKPLPQAQLLTYVGRKSIVKWGCYGCHDVPGFEEAKTIGTALADWGVKETSKLAFEHIVQYVEHGHGPAEVEGEGEGEAEGQSAEHTETHTTDGPLPDFYHHELEAGHREGFIYQKLREPRSYDYHKTQNKRYNERLRMPMFNLDHGDREAVLTFVLGLVADPPSEDYLYHPNPRREAVVSGLKVLEKYNCGGCHVLEGEKWQVAFSPDFYGSQPSKPTYPFATVEFTPEQLQRSAEVDRRGLRAALLSGMPAIADDGRARIADDEGDDLTAKDEYRAADVEYGFDLWSAIALDGHPYQVGEVALNVPARQIENRYASRGGDLAKYLLAHVVEREKQVNPNAKGAEAWGWLPPPLLDEGSKVQPEWLHDFLLEPFPIRPAVVLRMPKFNMSSQEATRLVHYFAATSQVDFPFEPAPRRRDSHLVAADHVYGRRLDEENPPPGQRFEDAVKVVTNNNYCIKCHLVGDFEPKGSDRAKAPDLAVVYRRLNSDYLRKWIGKPTSILPYTAMPVNITYDPNAPYLGTTVPQDLFHGTSVEQLDALVDLLMNFDVYTQQQTRIAPLVEKNSTSPPPAATGAGGGN